VHITLVIDTTKDDLQEVAQSLLRMAGVVDAEQTVKVSVDTSDLQKIIDNLGEPETPPAYVSGTTAPPPPPPPPVAQDEPDLDVETDDAGNVTSLTTAVSLPPPPPVPYSVPVSSVPPATPAPPGPAVVAELDARRLPWDGRIHAANRAKTIGGQWKYKRGVEKETVAAVEAEHGFVPPLASTPPAATPAPTAAATAPTAPPRPAPTAGIAAPAAVVPSAIDFRGLMQKIVTATNAKKLTDDQTGAAMAAVGLGVQDFAALIDKPTMIETVNAAIDRVLAT
jgi:hypothetical protein